MSKGYLPASLFPPTVLHRITPGALKMVQRTNPDHVLTIQHVTEYYDMKMVTFGVNDGEDLTVIFPVFVQDHTRESMTLHELETEKVPITDTNLAADSYTEVETSNPYIAFNKDYYIQLHIPELHMCKQIWSYFWSNTSPKCNLLQLDQRIYKYLLQFSLFLQQCNAQCFGWWLPNIPKRLICTYASYVACPVPSHNYVLVNRSMLCNCHTESGLTYLLKSIAFCETASADYTMSFTLNLAFLHMIHNLWPDNFTLLSPNLTKEEHSFPLGITSNAKFGQKYQCVIPSDPYA